MCGERDAPIEVVDYDPAWPGQFADELDRLALLPGAEVRSSPSRPADTRLTPSRAAAQP
jgi:hypothetical protein